MALITCPDCQTQVSDQAAACPKCGRPTEAAKNERKEKVSPLIVPGLIVAIVGGVMVATNFGIFGVLVGIAGGAMFLVGMLSNPK